MLPADGSFGPRTLRLTGGAIPRPESEVLIEAALREFPRRESSLDVLDLGTGSGCLLLAFLSERPNARGVGVDVSEIGAGGGPKECPILVARRSRRVLPLRLDVGVERRFDVVFANPPYVRTAELRQLEPELAYEPASALDGGADGLDAYRALSHRIRTCLRPGAKFFVEIGKGQADAVKLLFQIAGLEVSGTASDLSGITRCIVLREPD